MSSFRSLSIQDDVAEPSPEPESDIPRSQSIYSIDIPNSTLLWEVEPRPQNSENYFCFTTFAMSLNEIEQGMIVPTTLCPTDSRLRNDIRLVSFSKTIRFNLLKISPLKSLKKATSRVQLLRKHV